MQHRRAGDQLILRLDRGEEIVEELTLFCRTEGLEAATLMGIGAVQDTEIGYYDLATYTYLTRKVPEICEILSLSGNVALVDGDRSIPFVHAHVALGTRDFAVLGGHLLRATVAVTAEIVMTPLSTNLARRLDDEVRLKLWSL